MKIPIRGAIVPLRRIAEDTQSAPNVATILAGKISKKKRRVKRKDGKIGKICWPVLAMVLHHGEPWHER